MSPNSIFTLRHSELSQIIDVKVPSTRLTQANRERILQIPHLALNENAMKEFDDLVRIMSRLRNECPWDKEQSLSSLRTFLLEEAYECLDSLHTLEKEGPDNLIEELGDLLLQIVFQAEILSEQYGRNMIQKIVSGLNEKLIRRHPHVFKKESDDPQDAAGVLKAWDKIKENEKPKSENPFASIPQSMTALQRAYKIGKKSSKINFDWSKTDDVWKQVLSELKELETASTQAEKEEELGDLFFSLVQWARHQEMDAEVVLSRANLKFLKRFGEMLRISDLSASDFSKLGVDEKEELWRRVKNAEKQ
ncbi:MAG: nucleoside triphosphate pyrophosphohydrolase [Deltaproteobacteria bacterium CG11_big_fil_rev_8_21_14_0_20_45_16]|nr:MAG: nucleoside triphosphate pyrophosphohydrolase [Deltaproteobacteria bacterium CG11_big_fil_rev_8_21_14_0_20_45_16]